MIPEKANRRRKVVITHDYSLDKSHVVSQCERRHPKGGAN